MRLLKENTLLLVIDVQEKIFATMHEQIEMEENIIRLIKGAKAMDIPIVWTEQYTKGLGRTIKSVRNALQDYKVMEKKAFSCMGDHSIKNRIKSYGKKQILICGIEAHICVYQTALDLMERNLDVYIASDAVMSRKKLNYHLALERLRDIGAKITSVEMALFEIQKVAEGDTFKVIAELIK